MAPDQCCGFFCRVCDLELKPKGVYRPHPNSVLLARAHTRSVSGVIELDPVCEGSDQPVN